MSRATQTLLEFFAVPIGMLFAILFVALILAVVAGPTGWEWKL